MFVSRAGYSSESVKSLTDFTCDFVCNPFSNEMPSSNELWTVNYRQNSIPISLLLSQPISFDNTVWGTPICALLVTPKYPPNT